MTLELPSDFFSPATVIGRLRRALYDLLLEHERDGALPTSGRFLFYELVQNGTIPKQRTGARRADQNMIDALFDLREKGTVPWDVIEDETRALETSFVHPTVREWVIAVLDSDEPMLDPWWPDRAPMVVTESRSLAGVLRAILHQYRVTFCATNGQVGGFLRTKIAPALEVGDRVIYLGDLDLAGERHIEANTRRVLERLVGPLRWERLALTLDQVRTYNVPPMPKNDRRFKNGRGQHDAYETEALSQTVIVDIVRKRLDELLPEPLEAVLEREHKEKTDLRQVVEETQ